MSKLRPVRVFVRSWSGGMDPCRGDVAYAGYFHGWGVDYENEENGTGPHTVAIVESTDGFVELVWADLIQFSKTEDE